MTDVWEISRRRMDSEDKDCSSVGLVPEFKVLLYSPLVFNPDDFVMISTHLHNINVCLRPENMNGYTEAPGQTSLLKISKIVVDPIGSDPTLLPNSLFVPTHPPQLPVTRGCGGCRAPIK